MNPIWDELRAATPVRTRLTVAAVRLLHAYPEHVDAMVLLTGAVADYVMEARLGHDYAESTAAAWWEAGLEERRLYGHPLLALVLDTVEGLAPTWTGTLHDLVTTAMDVVTK